MPISEELKEKQRQKQQAALKRQAAGGVTKRELKRRRAAGEPLPKLPPKESKKRDTKPEKVVERTRPQHDVVIIPIFWRNVYGQEEAMVEEALRIKAILHKIGLDVWVDRTHKLTPGQKLNFWESQGVSYRVEIGPKEAAKHKCVISHQAGVAGDYSTVTKVANVSTIRQGELLAKFKGSLALMKISDEHILTANKDSAGDEEQLKKSKKNLELMEREDVSNVTTNYNQETSQWNNEKNAETPKEEAVKEEAEPKPLNAKERRVLRRQAEQEQASS